VHTVEQPIREPFLSGEGVGIEDIDFFLTVAVEIARCYTYRLPSRVSQLRRRDIFKTMPCPLQDEIRMAKSRHHRLELSIIIDICHRNPIIQLSRVVKQQVALVDEHRFSLVAVGSGTIIDTHPSMSTKTQRAGNANPLFQISQTFLTVHHLAAVGVKYLPGDIR